MKIIDKGICAVNGVQASGSRNGKYGVAVIYCKDFNATAVFTSNKIKAAPVIYTQKIIEDGKISAIVANSGNANCFTGKEGLKNAEEMARKVANHLNIDPQDVAVASTGIIGRQLPMNIIEDLIQESFQTLENSDEASFEAAEAIMTTDTYSKEIAVQTTLEDGSIVNIGGIAKGSGMIAPNMGTMLCFITTDIDASNEELQIALKEAVDESFNMVVVDADESTNDTVILLSSRESGKIDHKFKESLNFVCTELAKMMAKDGEGATKYMEVTVKGSTSKEEAKKAAKAIAGSYLVKTAIYGEDPNWGRVIAAVGYSGATLDENKIDITFSSDSKTVDIVKAGEIKVPEYSSQFKIAEKIMKENEIKIIINLNIGDYSANAYGCDLSCEYVKINSEYST